MWIFTEHGAFSVVAKREGNGTASRTQVWVRARSAEHLNTLKRHMDWSMRTEISTTADYQYRVTISRRDWYALARRLAEGVTYHNFKGRVLQREGSTRYERMLHHVWSLVRDWLDERAPDGAMVDLLDKDVDL